MRIYASVGPFAGDKDAAAHIRETYLKPEIMKGNVALLDFADVNLATQSFIHALIAAVVRNDPDSLDKINFSNCNDEIRSVIQIVVDYAQNQFE